MKVAERECTVQITNCSVLALPRRRPEHASSVVVAFAALMSNHTALFAVAAARWRGMAMPLCCYAWKFGDACAQGHDGAEQAVPAAHTGQEPQCPARYTCVDRIITPFSWSPARPAKAAAPVAAGSAVGSPSHRSGRADGVGALPLPPTRALLPVVQGVVHS
jgi:hypothetical protein